MATKGKTNGADATALGQALTHQSDTLVPELTSLQTPPGVGTAPGRVTAAGRSASPGLRPEELVPSQQAIGIERAVDGATEALAAAAQNGEAAKYSTLQAVSPQCLLVCLIWHVAHDIFAGLLSCICTCSCVIMYS